MYPGIAVNLEDGFRFVSDGAPVVDTPGLIDGCQNENQVVALCQELWRQALEARRPQIERMLLQERYYRGLHYREPWANRELSMTNMAFWAVETVWPILTEKRPRPDIMPLRPMQDGTASKIREFADWWQRRGRQERAMRRGTRTKLKFGESIYLLTIDYDTGMPYVMDWLPTDFYPDGSSRMTEDGEFFFLAAPLATRRLQAMYPDCAARIVPDNFTSPIYEAAIRPMAEMYATDWLTGSISAPRATNPDANAPYLSVPQPTGSTSYIFTPFSGSQHTGFYTTFLLQLIIRDYRTVTAVYPGQLISPQGIKTPYHHKARVPVSPNGWMAVQLTANGVMLDHSHLDPCFGGLPFVRDYDYEQDTSNEGIGEIENLIPINRNYDDRKNDLNRALDFSSTPVVVSTKGSGLKFDSAGVRPGDVLEPTRGSDLKFLEYRGPGSEHFEMLQFEWQDAQTVSGVQKAEAGEKPAGIEAGVALRELRSAAQTRIRGKEPGSLEAWNQVLTKGLHIAAKKLNRSVMFKASSGEFMTIDPQELLGDYSIVAAQGTASVESVQDMEDKTLALSDRGLLPPVEVLRRLNYPDWMKAAQMLMASAPAAPAPAGGGKPSGSPSGSESTGPPG